MEKKIIAFSGTHGTGKSTSVLDCGKCLKISNPDKKVGILMENVENSPLPINQQTTAESQLWIFTNQMQAEIAAAARNDILVCDRTVIDAIAYTVVAGYEKLAEAMIQLCKQHMGIYRHIYFKMAITNEYAYEDGFRAYGDPIFRQKIEETLTKLYAELGFDDTLEYI